MKAQLEEAKMAREEARDARKAEAEEGARSDGGGWGEDRGGDNPDDRRRGRPPPKARRGRTRLRE